VGKIARSDQLEGLETISNPGNTEEIIECDNPPKRNRFSGSVSPTTVVRLPDKRPIRAQSKKDAPKDQIKIRIGYLLPQSLRLRLFLAHLPALGLVSSAASTACLKPIGIFSFHSAFVSFYLPCFCASSSRCLRVGIHSLTANDLTTSPTTFADGTGPFAQVLLTSRWRCTGFSAARERSSWSGCARPQATPRTLL
jgi:hypothetical protein